MFSYRTPRWLLERSANPCAPGGPAKQRAPICRRRDIARSDTHATFTVNADALDQAKVAELEELQVGLFQRLALLFLQESPSDVARLRGALAAGDAREAKEAAHKIKGAGAAVGAANAHTAAAHLEQMAREGDLASAGPALVRLEESLEELEGALRRAGFVPPEA